MKPLAERLRPTTLDDYIGQKHLVGEGGVVRRMIESGRISSFILWGPPGVGKTTLAKIIAQRLETPFFTLSAVNSGVKEVREVIDKAKRSRFFGTQSPILFIDEIHRFSKSQQDSLLAAVEAGDITLIGATTENPSFEVIRPLLSRCQVYVLESLSEKELLELLERALKTDEVLKTREIEVREHEALLRYSGGDARKLLNILELVVDATPDGEKVVIDNERVSECLQRNPLAYDKDGEMHYDIISAYIKSLRGSDPDAALYWLARMIEGGEDPKFIARRLVISAAEDIGLANPNALLIANAAFDAVHKIGWPEGTHPLGRGDRLSGQQREVEQRLYGRGRRPAEGARNRKPARSLAFAQRSNQIDERTWLSRRIRLSARLPRALQRAAILARRTARCPLLGAGRQRPRSQAARAPEPAVERPPMVRLCSKKCAKSACQSDRFRRASTFFLPLRSKWSELGRF